MRKTARGEQIQLLTGFATPTAIPRFIHTTVTRSFVWRKNKTAIIRHGGEVQTTSIVE
jgi:hypothetical protein